MSATHIIRLPSAFVTLTASLLRRLYSTGCAVIALAIWRRRLLRGLNDRRRQ